MNSYYKTLSINAKKAWKARMPQGIVCRAYKFIYFPVPKVACSSMKRLIADLCELEQKPNPHCIDFEFVSGRQLQDFQDYFRFTVVRNPWNRLVSCYKHKIQHFSRVNNGRLFIGFERYNKILPIKAFYPEMSFDQFVKAVCLIPDVLSDEHFRSQKRLISDPKGHLLVEKVIKYENFDKDLTSIFKILGVPDLNIPHVNRTNPSNYRHYYDTQLKNLVARRYRSDIEMFGYIF